MLLVVVLLLRRHLHIQKFAALPMTPRLRIPPLTLPCGCRQVRTLADLDPLTLTAPCCSAGTPLMYLRATPTHPHAPKLLPLVEALLLQRGYVPFSDGAAIQVVLLVTVVEERREDLLKERVRSGVIDYRQFKVS